MQKTSPIGAQSILGAFLEFPFLMPHLSSPRSLYVWDIPMELLLDALSIFSLKFLGLHSCPCKARDKFIQLERVGLQGHFATNLYKNMTVIGRSVLNKNYQALSQQTLLLLLLCPQTNILWVIQVLRSFLDFTSYILFPDICRPIFSELNSFEWHFPTEQSSGISTNPVSVGLDILTNSF